MSSHSEKTTSTTFDFEISNYSLRKGIGVGSYVQSVHFSVGGHDWAIRFYPDGLSGTNSKQHAAVFLELLRSSTTQVQASYQLALVNRASGSRELIFSETRTFRSLHGSSLALRTPALVERSKLERESAAEDRLTIQCTLTVTREGKRKTSISTETYVPPSNLYFGTLFLDEETADVVFTVEGEAFPAHKVVLAARSPVFKAELHGQMKESSERCITVEGVRPDVFKALLHFAYTDEVPDSDWGELDEALYCEAVKHLLAAADRYAMDRLKLICASILEDFIDVENVASMLAFADQNSCASLKDVCINFMASRDCMEDVMATQDYLDLKRDNPSVLVDVLERTSKFRKRKLSMR